MLYALRAARLFSAATLVAVVLTPSVSAQVIDQFRIAAVNLSYVAQSSTTGKAALARIEEAGKKKEAEAAAKSVDLQKQQVELRQQGSAMSERARADLQKAGRAVGAAGDAAAIRSGVQNEAVAGR